MLVRAWRSPSFLVLGAISISVACAAIGLSSSSRVTAVAHAAPRSEPSGSTPSNSTPSVAARKETRGASARRSRCSKEMVLVEGTCVDRYEAHLLERSEGGALSVHPADQVPAGNAYVAACAPGIKPQGFISQVEAASACSNAGKRLCKLTEWYRACTGKSGTTYPYGSTYERGRCNVGKVHLLSMLHGGNASRWSYADFNDPKLAQTPGFLALSGEYSNCTSTEGAYDLVGNLHEWVADLVDESLRHKLPVSAVEQHRIGRHPGNGIFMGGFFSTMNQHGEGCNYATAAHAPSYHDYSTGFRCCRDAEAGD